MKKILFKIRQNQYFLLFILLFAYVDSIYSRVVIRGEINVYSFTPEAALATLVSVCILFLINRFFIQRWQKSKIFNATEMLKIFGSSTVVYVLLMQLVGFIIAICFDNVEKNFNRETMIFSTFHYLLNGIVYGSFYLAYYYYKKDKEHQRQLAFYNQVLANSKIRQLKAQLNPHFLFNNLNILDQLIDEDRNKASVFLNEFAEIYRYVLQVSDQEVVSLQEELEFAEKYFNLIKHKYGNAYLLEMKISDRRGYIVPLALQLLLENAVEHNMGTEANPIHIKLDLDNSITISNNRVVKRYTKPTSGRALNNLSEQYRLLMDQPITVLSTEDRFSVNIPIIS